MDQLKMGFGKTIHTALTGWLEMHECEEAADDKKTKARRQN